MVGGSAVSERKLLLAILLSKKWEGNVKWRKNYCEETCIFGSVC